MGSTAGEQPSARKKAKVQRAKVSKACVFCRRSHMSCNDERPCARCIKREIAHLCTDDNPAQDAGDSPDAPDASTSAFAQQEQAQNQPQQQPTPSTSNPPAPDLAAASPFADLPQNADKSYYNLFYSQPATSAASATAAAPLDPFTEFFNSAFQNHSTSFAPDSANPLGNETYGPGLSDFLKSLDEPSFFTQAAPAEGATGLSPSFNLPPLPSTSDTNGFTNLPSSSSTQAESGQRRGSPQQDASAPGSSTFKEAHLNLKPSNQNDRYLLAAADQKDGSRDERLARVIHAKFEAGLLKPYDYVAGYRRLFRWMELNMSAVSRQRTLQTISEFRPSFRAIAASLTDLDLILIEEAFERLLLDYDRVFTSMGVPACLWRRTGEIYKGNNEFAQLVGVPIDSLRDGKLAIYELMGEESAANYWEKYGSIAFNSGQKAVLTSCVLIHQAKLASSRAKSANRKGSPTHEQPLHVPREARLNCTFSFTVRRDSANIPYAIAGNFLRY